MLQQQFHDVRFPLCRRLHQRSYTGIRGRIDIGAFRDQKLCDFQLSRLGRHRQRGLPVYASAVNVRSLRQKFLNIRHVSVLNSKLHLILIQRLYPGARRFREEVPPQPHQSDNHNSQQQSIEIASCVHWNYSQIGEERR